MGFEPGEVIIEARRDGFCGWISKALVRKESAGKRAGGKRNEQGLLDTAQTRYGIPRVQWDWQRRARTFDDGGARFGENLAATMGTSTSSTTRRIPTGLSNDGGPPGPFSAGAYSTQAYSDVQPGRSHMALVVEDGGCWGRRGWTLNADSALRPCHGRIRRLLCRGG